MKYAATARHGRLEARDEFNTTVEVLAWFRGWCAAVHRFESVEVGQITLTIKGGKVSSELQGRIQEASDLDTAAIQRNPVCT